MSPSSNQNTLECLKTLTIGEDSYSYHSLNTAQESIGSLEKLPFCIRIFLENVLQHRKVQSTSFEDIQSLCTFYALKKNAPNLAFVPTHLILEENDAVSALTDIASLQNEIERQSPTPLKLTLETQLDIITNKTKMPLPASKERLKLLCWSQKHHERIRLVPPEKGAGCPIALNYLCDIVHTAPSIMDSSPHLSSDIILGSPPSISALGAIGCLTCKGDVLDIETISLGGALRLRIPSVFGINLENKPHAETSATDIGLALLAAIDPEKLDRHIIEFHGEGLDHLSVPDRAIIAAILNQTDALAIFFPVDKNVIRHLTTTGKTASHINVIEHYTKEQGLWRKDGDEGESTVTYSESISFNLSTPRPSLGKLETNHSITSLHNVAAYIEDKEPATHEETPLDELRYSDIILAEISACSSLHPQELLAAGLLAKKAHAKGLTIKPWVCGRIILGAPHIKDYLKETGVLEALSAIGFSFDNKEISDKVKETLSKGEPRVAAIRTDCPQHEITSKTGGFSIQASPLLIVAYGLAGTLNHDFVERQLNPAAKDSKCFLKDIWPAPEEIQACAAGISLPTIYHQQKAALFTTTPEWDSLVNETISDYYPWQEKSFWVKSQPLVILPPAKRLFKNIQQAQMLAIYGDHVHVDSIAPHGAIDARSAAGAYLIRAGANPDSLHDFEDYTGNHEVILRGAFLGEHLNNKLAPRAPIGQTIFADNGQYSPVYEVAERYREKKKTLLLAAGKNFGNGTRPEWAAKIIALTGVKAVIADSFAPAFRRSLIRVGVLPLVMKQGAEIASLELTPSDQINIIGFDQIGHLPAELLVTFEKKEDVERYMVICDVRHERELDMLKKGNLWSTYVISRI